MSTKKQLFSWHSVPIGRHVHRVLTMLLLLLAVQGAWGKEQKYDPKYEKLSKSVSIDGKVYYSFDVMFYRDDDSNYYWKPGTKLEISGGGETLNIDFQELLTKKNGSYYYDIDQSSDNTAKDFCNYDGLVVTKQYEIVGVSYVYVSVIDPRKVSAGGTSKDYFMTINVAFERNYSNRTWTFKWKGTWRHNTGDTQYFDWTFFTTNTPTVTMPTINSGNFSRSGSREVSFTYPDHRSYTDWSSQVIMYKKSPNNKWLDYGNTNNAYKFGNNNVATQSGKFTVSSNYEAITVYPRFDFYRTIVPFDPECENDIVKLLKDYGKAMYFEKDYTVTIPGFPRPKDVKVGSSNTFSKQVTITWTKEKQSSSLDNGTWIVFRRENGTNNLVKIASGLGSGTTSYIDKTGDLEYGKTYTYTVCYQPKGWTVNNHENDAKDLYGSVSYTLSRVKNLFSNERAALDSDGKSILLTWSHNSLEDASTSKTYTLYVQRSDDNGKTWKDIHNYNITDPKTTTGSYSDGTAESYRPYKYRLKMNAQEQDCYSAIMVFAVNRGSEVTEFTATRGTYSQSVKLNWKVNQVGSNLTYFTIQRRPLGSANESDWADIHTLSGTAANYSFDDVTAQPGSFYEYRVVVWAQFEGKEYFGQAETTDGFSYATGVVSGRVTYGTGTAVDGAKVVLKRQTADGDIDNGLRSLRFSGASSGLVYNADTTTIRRLFGNDFSVQMYLNPSDLEMSEDGNDYVVLDASNVFTVRLIYHADKNAYELKGWLDQTEELTGLFLPANQWSHITMAYSAAADSAKMNVTVINSETTKPQKAVILEGKSIDWTGKGKSCWTIAFGNYRNYGYTRPFAGHLDEIRFFTKALSDKDIERNYCRTLAGDEAGLALYYPLDEDLSSQKFAYDFSKTNGVSNGRHAIANVAAESTKEVLPGEEQLSLMAYTDNDGNYVIRGVPFSGEGTSYSVIPQLGIHEFSPAAQSRYVSMSSLIHNGVDFEDVSSFPVSGTVRYANTDYPVEGVNFYVDGTLCSKDGEVVTTNEKGEYTISVPIGDHFIRVEKNGHVFANAGRYPEDPNNLGTKVTFNKEIKNLDFEDETLVNFTGRVVGGSIEGDKTVGFGLSENNIGVVEFVLTPVNETPRMNVVKPTEEGTFGYDINENELPVASATDKINSKAWRGAVSMDECKKFYIETDPATGEFSAMLPPLQYNVSAMKIKKNGNEVAQSQTIDLSNPNVLYTDTLYSEDGKSYELYEYNTLLRQTYHSPASFTVTQEGRTDGSFGIANYKLTDDLGELKIDDIYSVKNGKVEYKYGGPLFVKEDPYVFLLEGFEEYTNADNGAYSRVPLENVVVTINNALSAEQSVYVVDGTTVEGQQVKAGEVADLKENQLQLDEEGKAIYKWRAGLPNIAYPYTRTITMNYDIEGRSYAWEYQGNTGVAGIVLGDLATGNNFVTAGPDKLLMVLRDPPGTNSFAEWTTGTAVTSSTVVGASLTNNTGSKLTTSFGFTNQQIIGTPGTGTITEISSENDIALGVTLEAETETSTTTTYATTTTKGVSTSAAPEYVGDQGDVFIGTSTNIIFGKARNVGFKREAGNVKLELEDITTTGMEFNTMFHYTRNYIENVMFPNFELMRKSLLKTVASQSEINSYQNTTDHVVYLTTLSPDDENFGKDKTYKAIAPKNPKQGEVYADSVRWINNQMENWVEYLKQNEKAKVEAYADRDQYLVGDNISFDSGTTITNSTESSSSVSRNSMMKISASIVAGVTTGFTVNDVGLSAEIENTFTTGTNTSEEEEKTNTTTFSYTLAEDGDDEALSVDVYQYDEFGPIFRTRGGQTSCPYEGKVVTKYYEPGTTIMEATMQIEVPQIDVDVPILSDIPTGGAANYTLRLSNASEIDEDVYYRLIVADETNPHGANLMMDGKPVTDSRVIKIPAGQTVTKALQLKQTNTSILDYEDIAVVLASQCQFDPTSTWEVITDTVYLSAHFVPSSSPVTLSLSNKLMNTQTGTDLTLSFKDFDRNYRGLKAFRIQYKRQGATDWTLLREYVLDPKAVTTNNELLPTTGSVINYKLPMAQFSDGDYVFRVLSVSTYGQDEITLSSEEITLVKDLQRPTPLGAPEPADGILNVGDDLSITFNEAIIKGELTKDANFHVTGVLNGAPVDHQTALKSNDGSAAARTEASIMLAGKDFSTDMWVKLDGAGTLLAHGNGANKFTVGTNNDGKLVIGIGNETYISEKNVPTGKWAFLTLSYRSTNTGGSLNATVADDATTTQLFVAKEVCAYDGNGSLSVGGSSAAIHELLLWDEAHDMTTALLQRSRTKSPSTKHLIGYWKMNEGEGTTIRDYARNRHMAMPSESWYLNNENKAVVLNGKNYLSIDASDMDIYPADDYAVEFWVRGNKQAGEAQLMQMGEIALWTDAEGALQLTGKGAYNPNSEEQTVLSTSSMNLLDNVWHHVAVNVLRQGTAAVFVDGKRCLTTSAQNVGGIATNNLLMGVRRLTQSAQTATYGYDRNFKGEIDEIRVWNATLNADKLLSNRKVRLTGKEDGLIAYYPFEIKTVDAFNQVITVGYENDLSRGTHAAQLISTTGTQGIVAYTDEAPALRVKPVETNVAFTFTASDEKIVIDINEDPATIEGCTLNFTVRDVRDNNGNYSLPAVWSAFVNRNELIWKESTLSAEQPVNASSSVTATIVNKGGKQQMWAITGMPSWLTASAEDGVTNPLSETDITFTVSSSTAIGKYEETIYLIGNDGIETPLTLKVKVTGDEPQWTVDVNNYEQSMNVIGTLEIQGIPSDDSDDIVAAFIDDECRGVARLEYKERYDNYFVTMDIYGHNNNVGKKVEFKVYDASSGIVYPVVNTNKEVKFGINEFVGRYNDPLLISATDMVGQDIALNKGWNWMSMSVRPDDMTVPAVFENAGGKVTTVKSQNGATRYDNGNWLGKVSGQSNAMNNVEMYAVQATEDVSLNIVGHRVNQSKTPIVVKNGWNWIGYNGLTTVSVSDGLAGMNPQDGDIIKAQRGVAYYDGYEWVGNLRALNPGQGYKIQSVASNDRTFTYPVLTTISANRIAANGQAMHKSQFNPVDYRKYAGNMVLFAQVVHAGQPVEGIELGVFSDGECREAAVTDEQGMVYITIPGDEENVLTFRAGNGTATVNLSNYDIVYRADAVCGTPHAPFILDLGQVTGIESLGLTTEYDTTYDLSGRKLVNKKLSERRKGVYIVNGQKVVVK